MDPLNLLFDALISALEEVGRLFEQGEYFVPGSEWLIWGELPPKKYIEAVIEHKVELVGMSAFLTTTMPMFKKNIEAFKEAGVRDKVKVKVS